MAISTTNLSLYKKESTDGADTFNITTMLNDNWDKIDAFSAEIEEKLGVKVIISQNQPSNQEQGDIWLESNLINNSVKFKVNNGDGTYTQKYIDDPTKDPAGTAASTVAAHNADAGSHQDIRDRLHNANLLDNWYFVDPINQRGYGSYNNPWGYSIDRWIVSYALTLTDNGIVLNTPQDERAWFLQRLEHKYFDQLLTLTVLVNDTLYTVTGSMSSAEKNIIYKSIPNGNMAIEINDDDGVQFVVFTANKGESITIQAAKLELGDKQTLARQDSNGQWVLLDPPNKALELAKCQRYYQHIPILYAPGTAISGTLCYVAVSVPVSMRIAPTSVALDLGILSAGGNQYTPSDIAIAACNNNQVHLGVLGSGFAMGDVCLLHDAVIALSADL